LSQCGEVRFETPASEIDVSEVAFGKYFQLLYFNLHSWVLHPSRIRYKPF
jgi:hypothetical protein